MVAMNGIKEKLILLKWVLTDCDGVLTDGGMYYGANGECLKRFHVRDGLAVDQLRRKIGVETGIVTGESCHSVLKRAEKLRISEVYLGVEDKGVLVEDFIARHGLKKEEVAYIGDDINDLPAFEAAGLSFCPIDACEEVKAAADCVLTKAGGQGVFRELADRVLSLRGG